MLTVKHLAPDGAETIYEAHRVVTEPLPTGERGHNHWRVRIDEASTGWLDLAGGMAYVMNELAHTMAKYHLAPVEAPKTPYPETMGSVQGPQRPMTLADQSR